MERQSNGPYKGNALASSLGDNIGLFSRLCTGITINLVNPDLNISNQQSKKE